MDLITVDFETYYDKDYSLSKMTTEQYINDPRFEVIGVSVRVNDDKVRWVTGPKDTIAAWLGQFNWDDALQIAHNNMFDAAILAWHFNIHPITLGDTLGMARALFPNNRSHSLASMAKQFDFPDKGTEVYNMLGKHRTDLSLDDMRAYGEYCKHDTWLSSELFIQMVDQGFPKVELRLIDLTLRMFIYPQFQLNLDKLETHLLQVREAKETLLERAGVTREELMSNDKLVELLQGFGITPPTKISARTGKEAWAFAKTDQAFKDLLEYDDDDVQALVAARMGVKTTIEETRTERFIDIAKRIGVLPIPLRYYGAATGRWSGCLVADTVVLVYDYNIGVVEKQIVDVLPDDLVWDGVEFVPHDGVTFSGYKEVISYDGIIGTPEHIVYTSSGEVSLYEAQCKGYKIEVASLPTKDQVESARRTAREAHNKS